VHELGRTCRLSPATSAERGRFGRLWKYLPNKTFQAHMQYMNSFCMAIIQERRQEPAETLAGRKDLLSRILTSVHVRLPCSCACCCPASWLACPVQADGSPFSEADILDFLRNFLIAGRDTTAELLTWCVYLLSQHADVEAAVLAEIDTVIGAGPITMEALQQLKYTKAVLQETLRLYPPGTMRCTPRSRVAAPCP
jgi:cytochrome P450